MFISARQITSYNPFGCRKSTDHTASSYISAPIKQGGRDFPISSSPVLGPFAFIRCLILSSFELWIQTICGP